MLKPGSTNELLPLMSCLWTCSCVCAAKVWVALGSAPQRDEAGKPACELCWRRLSRPPPGSTNKETRTALPGQAHKACLQDPVRAEALRIDLVVQRGGDTAATAAVTPATASTPAKPSRKRRAASDPGEQPVRAQPRSATRRVTAPKPPPAPKKQRAGGRSEEEIIRMLDETASRREAWLVTQH